MAISRVFTDDIAIVLAGEAGKGIQTIEQILDRVLMRAGYHVFSTGEFMSRIRGGSNSTLIRVSSTHCASFTRRMDVFIPLDALAKEHCRDRISERTLVVGDGEKIGRQSLHADIPLSRLALESGGRIYENSVAAGLLLGFFRVNPVYFEEFIGRQFEKKGADVVAKNIQAGRAGMNTAREILDAGLLDIKIPVNGECSSNLLLTGVDAAGLGAIAGGCNFVSSYPMSPSTEVITFLASQSHEFSIVVEQAEDEIAALNMVLGAWYAGARGLATTSGGGFALMCEAVSLAGMIESPAVIHIGQRPGPATGLPTRTEQGDLELALYAGHGEFPRVIFAPGTLEESFALTHRAFNLADECQVPVFILTDEFLLDSYAMTPPFDIAGAANKRHIVPTGAAYKRYALTPSGISPRSIPGYGEGIVRVDSDEHTEEGYITESMAVRTAMVDKRLRKLRALVDKALPPRHEGGGANLVICWGSTYHVVKEAVARLGRPDVGLLHFSQLWPLHPDTERLLKSASLRIIVENNATSQLAKLIRQQTGVTFDRHILHYNGLPPAIEDVEQQLRESFAKERK